MWSSLGDGRSFRASRGTLELTCEEAGEGGEGAEAGEVEIGFDGKSGDLVGEVCRADEPAEAIGEGPADSGEFQGVEGVGIVGGGAADGIAEERGGGGKFLGDATAGFGDFKLLLLGGETGEDGMIDGVSADEHAAGVHFANHVPGHPHSFGVGGRSTTDIGGLGEKLHQGIGAVSGELFVETEEAANGGFGIRLVDGDGAEVPGGRID